MSTHRIEVTLTNDGTLTLNGLPFHAGDAVEVLIVPRTLRPGAGERYPLRGKPIRYEHPAEPVAQDDWEVLR